MEESEDGKKSENSGKNDGVNEKTTMFSKNFYKLISQNSQLQEQFQQYSLANFQNSDYFKSKKQNDILTSTPKANSNEKSNVSKPKEGSNKILNEENELNTSTDKHQLASISPSQAIGSSLDALNSVNTLHMLAAQSPTSQQNLLAQFMTPAALAAAVYYNSSKPNNLLVPLNSNNASIYQRSYLEALNFYKAACNANGLNAPLTPTN